VQRYRQKNDRGDIIRYARLPGMEGDYQVFLTRLAGDEVLALVFSASTPLSKIRVRTGNLVQALDSLLSQRAFDRATGPARPTPTVPPAAEGVPGQLVNLLEDRWFLEETTEPVPVAEAALPPVNTRLDENDEVDQALDAQLHELDLAALLGAIPTPDPDEDRIEAVEPVWMPTAHNAGLPLPWDVPVEPLPDESLPATGTLEEVTQPVLVVPPTPVIHKSAYADIPLDLEDPPLNSATDTRPSRGAVLTPPTSLNQLEPASPGMSQIYYTCVLIPRLPQHFLTREIGERVGQWIQQLCLAYDWRLEGIAIRPEYLQWMVQVEPSISPGSLVKIIRQRTSHYLFTTNERLHEENPSDDFWASGYLIISGAQPPAARLLREYIHETRRRQTGGSALRSGAVLQTTTYRE
jgi:REP element-mobilizing transposase RayT